MYSPAIARQRPGELARRAERLEDLEGATRPRPSLSGPRHSPPVGHAEASQRVALAQRARPGRATARPTPRTPRPPAPTGRAWPARGRARRAGRPAPAAGRCRRTATPGGTASRPRVGTPARPTGRRRGGRSGPRRRRRARPRRGGPVGRRRLRTARARRGCGGASRRRCAGRPPARSARRAISWRNRSTAPSATSRPRRRVRRAPRMPAPVTACEQVGLDPLADQGRGVEHLASGRRQPGGAGEHRVARRRRQLLALGAQHLADEERVAAGERVHGVRLVARRRGSAR